MQRKSLPDIDRAIGHYGEKAPSMSCRVRKGGFIYHYVFKILDRLIVQGDVMRANFALIFTPRARAWPKAARCRQR